MFSRYPFKVRVWTRSPEDESLRSSPQQRSASRKIQQPLRFRDEREIHELNLFFNERLIRILIAGERMPSERPQSSRETGSPELVMECVRRRKRVSSIHRR